MSLPRLDELALIARLRKRIAALESEKLAVAAQERAKIVAWLRTKANATGEIGLHMQGAARWFADHIECGDHDR